MGSPFRRDLPPPEKVELPKPFRAYLMPEFRPGSHKERAAGENNVNLDAPWRRAGSRLPLFHLHSPPSPQRIARSVPTQATITRLGKAAQSPGENRLGRPPRSLLL